MKEEARLVFVPCPLMGHFLGMLELAKLILQHPTPYRFSITVVALPPLHPNPQLSSIISATRIPNLSFLELQPITPPHFPTAMDELVASLTLDFYAPHVKSAISAIVSSSTAPVAALVVDFLFLGFIDVVIELGIPPYVYCTFSASLLGFYLHMILTLRPLLSEDMMLSDWKGETLPIPGFISKVPADLLPGFDSMGKHGAANWFMQIDRRMVHVKGVLVNTFTSLETSVVKAHEEGLYSTHSPAPPVYPIGPILSLKADPGHECISWLNEQPRRSVVFLCFGSFGSFPETQVKEIAAGLERSGHRFLWILRAPPKPGQGTFVTPTDAVLEEVLPEGFLERTKERGLVWPSFAPQAEILGHTAVGGFVTHCGWNSFLESLWFGVPTAAWPMYAEQHFNAFVMVEELAVAVGLRIERWEGNRASAEEVERAVRVLMGEERRSSKVKELKEEARKAVAEGGSSSCALERMLHEWAACVSGHIV